MGTLFDKALSEDIPNDTYTDVAHEARIDTVEDTVKNMAPTLARKAC